MHWRKQVIRELRGLAGIGKAKGNAAADPTRDSAVLDVATGTGDMAILLSRYLPQTRVTGVDISAGMLEIGRRKLSRLKLGDHITLEKGDSEALPYSNDTYVAFGVRNFENLEKGLREMKRVLRPGGRLVVLEFSQPRTPGISHLYRLYMRMVAPRIAGIASSNREAYQYLSDSVQAFPEGEDLVRILKDCGYVHTRLRRLSLGICTLYTGEKVTIRN
jgi:demethylmenaquinone methyltransferase/2-methoxy-6-polyprenyl-1,4-benzoquinol methylase